METENKCEKLLDMNRKTFLKIPSGEEYRQKITINSPSTRKKNLVSLPKSDSPLRLPLLKSSSSKKKTSAIPEEHQFSHIKSKSQKPDPNSPGSQYKVYSDGIIQIIVYKPQDSKRFH